MCKEVEVEPRSTTAVAERNMMIKNRTRETSMEMSLEKQKPPDILAEQRASNKLVKLIRKLRWMRMEEEAERVQMDLAQRGAPPADSVLAAPHETD
jgi:hypothetical protein